MASDKNGWKTGVVVLALGEMRQDRLPVPGQADKWTW